MKEEHPHILVLYIPHSCTAKLQPQDVVFQRPFKGGTLGAFKMHQLAQFQKAEELARSPDGGAAAAAALASMTDFRLSNIKQYVPGFLLAGWTSVAKRPEMVVAGWAKCGLIRAWDADTQARAVKAMADPEDEFYPLFKQGDRSALPPPEMVEPALEPISQKDADPGELDDDEAAFVAQIIEEVAASAAAERN